MNNRYGDFEEKIFEDNPLGIENVKQRLGLDNIIGSYNSQSEISHAQESLPSGNSMERPNVRVLTNGEHHNTTQDVPIELLSNQSNYNGEANGVNPFNSGSSFILAFAGILVLIFVISIITFSVLKYLNI